MMMAYGLFVFGLSTAAYDSLQHQLQWRHAATSRIGERPVRQYLGPGDNTITLAGQLLPQFTGGQQNLDDLEKMGNDGYAWPLIEGSGRNYGVYVIESLDQDKSLFFRDGAAQQIGFNLKLQRVDDSRKVRIGTLTPGDIDPARLARGLGGLLS